MIPVSAQEIITGGSAVLVLMTLVQIAPIKISPWSAIGNTIKKAFTALGMAMNKGVIERISALEDKIDSLETRFNDHEGDRGKDKADERRADILRFNREVIRGLPHTMEDFIEVISYIDYYEKYCAEHPKYENNRAVMAIQNIERAYREHLKANDFE